MDDWGRLVLWAVLALVFGGAAVIFGPSVLLLGGITYYAVTTPPPNWNVVQAKGSDCQLKDDLTLSNHHGMVAVLREANCPGAFAQGMGYNVVLVHRVGEPNNKDNLAFQYAPGFEGNTLSPLPKLVWQSKTVLAITVPGVIDDIKVQKSEIDGIELSYTLDYRYQHTLLDFL